MQPAENQCIEWKESWKDDCLQEICAFANAQGGSLFIGIDNTGGVVGITEKACRKLTEDLPNKVLSKLGIVVDVNTREKNGATYLEIAVAPASCPVCCDGRYYYRSGSTCQLLTGNALNSFLTRKTGFRWEDITLDRVDLADLDEESFRSFRTLALRNRRITPEDAALPRAELLQRLNLVDDDGRLKRAAILLFHRTPERWFAGAWVKIGFFANDADILYQDEVHGSLIMQAERVIDLIYTKYLRAPITYEGVIRVERYPFPREAVREALYNALIHSDYSSNVPIQIRVYENRLEISNKAQLPPDWTAETLLSKHVSNPLNPLLAGTFFRAGFVESWGRGIEKICRECTQYGNPSPEYSLSGFFVTVSFNAEDMPQTTPIAPEVQPQDRQSAILCFLRSNPNATYEQVAQGIGVPERTLYREIARMITSGLIMRDGSTRKTRWIVLVEAQEPSETINGSNQDVNGGTGK